MTTFFNAVLPAAGSPPFTVKLGAVSQSFTAQQSGSVLSYRSVVLPVADNSQPYFENVDFSISVSGGKKTVEGAGKLRLPGAYTLPCRFSYDASRDRVVCRVDPAEVA